MSSFPIKIIKNIYISIFLRFITNKWRCTNPEHSLICYLIIQIVSKKFGIIYFYYNNCGFLSLSGLLENYNNKCKKQISSLYQYSSDPIFSSCYKSLQVTVTSIGWAICLLTAFQQYEVTKMLRLNGITSNIVSC